MLCFLYRWFLSRSIDLDKPIPAFLSRHRQRCHSCQEFSDFCTALKPKAAHEFKNLLNDSSVSPHKRVPFQEKTKTVNTRKRLFSIPSLSAAAAVLVIFVCLVWLTFFPVEDKDFPDINLTSLSLKKAAMNLEDPYEKEYLELKRTVKSTADYLAACLDIRINNSIE